MVLPLQKLCLAALRDSLKDRPNPRLHEIPPPNHRQNLRQDLLDLVLASGVIMHENAYVSLSSPEFLDGLSKLNTQRGITSDREFLDRVAGSLSVQRNGKTIGEGIMELKLNVYVHDNRLGFLLNLDSAVRIISQCPNLKILHLAFTCDKLGRRRWRDENLLAGLPTIFGDDSSNGILNLPMLAPCFRVLENVEELSLSAETFKDALMERPYLVEKCPNFKFRRLSSLHLAYFAVDEQAWKEMLMTVKISLVELEVQGLGAESWGGAELDSDEDSEAEMEAFMENDKDWIMPFPMPHLRSFKTDSGRYTCQLIKNLMECPELEKVEMFLRADWQREDAMRLLSQMNANVSVELGLFHEADQDRDSNFKWVNLFKEKITKVRFRIFRWKPQHSAALENLFAACPDLVEMSFAPISSPVLDEDEDDSEDDTDEADVADVLKNRLMATVNSDLAPFLRDQTVVSKLRKLELFGPFDHAVLDALFENATNLESLKVEDCPQLSDSHLQMWASRGGRPERLVLWGCDNITDDGLVPILISSGQRMKYFGMCDAHLDRISKFTWRTLVDHCPFFNRPLYLSEQLKSVLGSE